MGSLVMSKPSSAHLAAMLGKWCSTSLAGLCEMLRSTCESPRSISSLWIERATMSRGASSILLGSYFDMNRSPPKLYSSPPSPRTASEMRKVRPLLVGSYSAVGWNWMNSMLLTRACARNAMAMPSPVATCGLVVLGYTWPAPPHASMVDSVMNLVMAIVRWSSTSAPKQCGTPWYSSVTRSTARWCSKKRMLGCARAVDSSARSISRPVRSAACTTRRLEWPPSLVRCRLPSSLRVNSAPICTSSSTRAGPSRHTTSTA
mmetsp:Transcript_37468/g.94564  ORF Transcript_37468/g.94564 Transcript_37468/m.94564 type:complete len:260 (-) Transcript_37468:761-1540(-)